MRRLDNTKQAWGICNDNNRYAVLQHTNGKTYAGYSAALYEYSNPASVGWNLCCFQWAGSGAPVYHVDTGLVSGASVAGPPTGSNPSKLGARISGASEYTTGYIAFVLFCAANHTAEERGLVEQYVKSQFPTLVQY